MSITENFSRIKNDLPSHVELVAVSKTYPKEDILEVYNAGQRIFGENKVQELLSKARQLPSDIEWHLIGHLQSNKVRQIVPFAAVIQSVDSEKLVLSIDQAAAEINKKQKILLQIKIAQEDSKYGLRADEAEDIYRKYIDAAYPNLEITGIMGMATFTNDVNTVKKEFAQLRAFFEQLNKLHPLETLSMGMSGDYHFAIENGSNSVRIGSAIFGSRNS